MLNSETKRHIDAARDVLVGVAPNPTTQIDQITYALIYKFMDDMDQAAIKAGGEPSFFTGELEPYAWSKLVDSRMGNQEKMNLYGEALTKFSEAKQLPELFRTIFRAAFLPYRSPETLGLFLKEISYFDYTHPEELGNAYEYLLSIMSSQGDAGQFRTPRHIIDFIVDVINPTKNDKVLDPACGTAGFLVSTYNHILEQHDGIADSKKVEKPLTPDERKTLMQNLQGYDIDPTMVRIAQVNMYLHQFKNPQIFQYDSLTNEERWADKFDVILANPPFMSPKGGIKPHSKFSVASNRAEVLFVDYIVNHLRPKGRAGIVVPEGIIFQNGKAYKELRRNLVENGLYAVVSLPSGVFQPYSGVKTSILLIDNEIGKTHPEIAFIKISADGFDLGSSKRPVERNDLPTALDTLIDFKNSKKQSNSITSYVLKSEIAEAGDFNLSGDRYLIGEDYSNAIWPMVELGEIADYVNGFAFKPSDWSTTGTPIIRIQNLTKTSQDINRTEKSDVPDKYIVENGDLLISWSATIGFFIWQGSRAYLNQHIFKVIPSEKINRKYFYYLGERVSEMIRLKTQGNTMTHITKGSFNGIKIPLPPIEIQEQIVAELDGFESLISGAKQTVSTWKPEIDIDPEWPLVPLSEVCDVRDGTHDSPAYQSEGIPLITSKNLVGGKIDFTDIKFISHADHEAISKRSKVDDGDILMAMIGTIGNAVLVKKQREFSIKNVALFKLQNSERLLNQYLHYLLTSRYVEKHLFSQQKGVTQKFLSLGDLRGFKIPLPSLETQRKIVESIEFEKHLIESSMKLIEIYESRRNSLISKLWND